MFLWFTDEDVRNDDSIVEEPKSENIPNDQPSVSSDSSLRKYDSSIDTDLPDTVTLLTTHEGCKVYLVGTAHFSLESQNDVSKVRVQFNDSS